MHKMQSGTWKSIKDLVFEMIRRSEGKVDYDTITVEVKKCFPKSKWQKTHWGWYKSQIKNGRFKDVFPEDVRRNLTDRSKKGQRGQTKTEPVEQTQENKIKRIGDALLNHVRFVIGMAAGDDVDFRFKVNRWIFARLQQEEIRLKRPIKQKLWDSGMKSCVWCGKKFDVLKEVEIHRKNPESTYSIDNCILVCRPCHQKLV